MQKILSIVVIFFLTGCVPMLESVRTANTQNILVQTPRVEGATCDVTDGVGRNWSIWETPGSVAVQEGHPPLVIICTKKGFKKSVLTINEQKEEILTIDGKRIDFSVFGHFPTKFPRLIPSAVREVAGFAQDPTGSISTEYPHEITVWMEPKYWESEEQMRQWAFDRGIKNRADFLNDEERQLVENKRKAKRRADKKARKEKVKGAIESARKGVVKGIKNTAKIFEQGDAIKHVVKKSIGQGEEKPSKQKSNLRSAAEAVNKNLRKGASGLAPGTAVDFLNNQNKVRANVRRQREEAKRMAEEDAGNSLEEYNDGDSLDFYDDVEPSAGGNKRRYKYDRNGNRIAR